MLVATYCPLALETETVLPSARLVPAAVAGPAGSSGSMAATIPARASAAVRSLRDLVLSRMASSCRRADGWHAAEPCPRPDVSPYARNCKSCNSSLRQTDRTLRHVTWKLHTRHGAVKRCRVCGVPDLELVGTHPAEVGR